MVESVKHRIAIERAIVERVVDALIAANYRVAVSLERGYDLDEMLMGSRDRDAIIDAATAGDECHIFAQPAKGKLIDKGRVVSDGWIYLVFGNDGYDLISDYTTNLESLLAPVNTYADTIAEQES